MEHSRGNKVIEQKVDYIHHNPIEADFVNKPEVWRLSSANPNKLLFLSEL